MCGECTSALLSNGIRCVRLTTYELLDRTDISGGLQRTQVRGKVTVSHVQHLFQADKVIAVIGGQHRHDTQTDTILEQLIVTVRYYYRTLFRHGS